MVSNILRDVKQDTSLLKLIKETQGTRALRTPYFDIDALILKSFTFRTNYSQTRFSNQDELINSYKFWDASLSYRKSEDSKWEFEVKATNLLDTKSQSNSSTSNISISSSEYFIQPRFITFRFIYIL